MHHLLLRKLSDGASEADLEAYPNLTREDIHAAMRYAADMLAHEEVVFVAPDVLDRVSSDAAMLDMNRSG